jgi:hypothetical protein
VIQYRLQTSQIRHPRLFEDTNASELQPVTLHQGGSGRLYSVFGINKLVIVVNRKVQRTRLNPRVVANWKLTFVDSVINNFALSLPHHVAPVKARRF